MAAVRGAALRMGRSTAPAMRQRRTFLSATKGLQMRYQPGTWTPLTYKQNFANRQIITKDTTLFQLLCLNYRVNIGPDSIEGRIGQFLENMFKNCGYISLRSRAFNYSSHYYFGLMHRITTDMMYNARILLPQATKVMHLMAYLHGGQTEKLKAIIRKPVNYRYYHLWNNTKFAPGEQRWTFDEYVYMRKCATGDIKLPPMRMTAEMWRRRLYNAFEASK